MPLHYYPLMVTKVIHETPKAVSLYFSHYNKSIFSYKPGQYITLRIPIEGKFYNRSYSLSSSPLVDDFLRITIKATEGGFVSNYIRQYIEVGDELLALPPMGKFYVEIDPQHKKHYILIGGGSGITPLFSILRSILIGEPRSRVSLLYANRYLEDIIFKRELDELKQAYPNRFELHYVLSRPPHNWNGLTGRIEGENAEKWIQALQAPALETHYYLCGPYGLIENVENVLLKWSISPDLIHKELFTAPPSEEEMEEALSEQLPHKVIIHLDGKTHEVTVQPGQTILEAAIEAGLDPPFACQEGICTTCRAKLYSGTVRMREREGLSDEEIAQHYILTCQSLPLDDDVELEYG